MKILLSKYWYIAIIIIILFLFFIPPIVAPDKYLVINNDTANHLKVFHDIKNGSAQYLYLAQKVVGYPIIWISNITGTSIENIFMWFNFIMLALGSLVIFFLVYQITRNIITGLLSMIIITFGMPSVMQLFYSGTIFNIIEFLIILPLIILALYKTIKDRKIVWASMLVLLVIISFCFHPSLGGGITWLFNNYITKENVINPVVSILQFFQLSNLLLLFYGIYYAIKNRDNFNHANKMILIGIGTLSVMLIILTFTNLTPFSSRMLFNTCIVTGLLMCILIGNALSINQDKRITATIYILTTISILPNLIRWLSLPNYKEVLIEF